MLVIISNDQQTIDGGNVLKKMYPNEATVRFDSFMIKEGKVRKEKDGSLPKRVTMLSHGTETEIDQYSAEEFVEKLIQQLTEAAKIDPGIKKSLHTIDILACNVGLLAPQGKQRDVDCLALTVARGLRKLEQQGFNPIKVNAFSNTALKDPNVSAINIRMNYAKNAVEACVIPNEESLDKYIKLVIQRFDATDKLDEIIDERDKLVKKIEAYKNKFTKAANNLDDQENKIQTLKNGILNVATQIADILDRNKAQNKLTSKQFSPIDQATLKRLRESQNKMIEEITVMQKKSIELTKLKDKAEKSVKKLNHTDANLEKQSEALQQSITKLRKKEDDILQIIASSTDVRKTLDNNPSYHFHTLAKDLDKIKKAKVTEKPAPQIRTPRPGRG